jgi:hypothetical protein
MLVLMCCAEGNVTLAVYNSFSRCVDVPATRGKDQLLCIPWSGPKGRGVGFEYLRVSVGYEQMSMWHALCQAERVSESLAFLVEVRKG